MAQENKRKRNSKRLETERLRKGREGEISRTYKDRTFRIVFQEKEELLKLYNALAGTAYDNPEQLEVNTIENVIYIHMKNDISFLLDGYLNLYEHQASYNPNMPLRGLFYISDLYKERYKNTHLYSTSVQKIPTPNYIVFYNGTKEMPDRTDLRLSDSFIHPDKSPDLEVVAHMLNINYGHNQSLMEKCSKLKEYAQFVSKVREAIKLTKETGEMMQEVLTKEEAVEKAITECIKEGILVDILTRERARMVQAVLGEFDEEEYEKMIRGEGYQEGVTEGIAIGEQRGIAIGEQRINQLNSMLAEQNRMEDMIKAAGDTEYQKKLFAEFGI